MPRRLVVLDNSAVRFPACLPPGRAVLSSAPSLCSAAGTQLMKAPPLMGTS